MSSKTTEEKDEILLQFLSMTEDRCDTEVATSILEAHNWDLQESINNLFGSDGDGGGGSLPSPTTAAAIQAAQNDRDMTDTLIPPNLGGSNEIPPNYGYSDSRRNLEPAARQQQDAGFSIFNAIGSLFSDPGEQDSTGNQKDINQEVNSRAVRSRDADGATRGRSNRASTGQSSSTNGRSRTNNDAGADAASGQQSSAVRVDGRSRAPQEPHLGDQQIPSDNNIQTQFDSDEAMARAIQESMQMEQNGSVPGIGGGFETEEEMINRALAASSNQAQVSERDMLRQQQEMELQESMLMDRMREEEARKEREELEAVQEIQRAEAAAEQAKKDDKLSAAKRAFEALRPEPEKSSASMSLMFKFPNGKSVRRRFYNDQITQDLYSFVDGQLLEQSESEASAAEMISEYALMCTFPRMKVENDSAKTLVESRLEDQTVLMVQAS